MPLGDLIALSQPAAAAPLGLSERADDELMTLARAGLRDAFAVVVGRHTAALTEYCVKMTGERRIGEDVAQETWLAAWAARDRYRPSGQLAAFLFTIARNRCRNALRARGRRRRVITEDTAPDLPHFQASGLDEMLARENARRIHEAALELPPKLREAVLLRFVAGLEYPAISAAIGRNESTVRSRVFHGLRRLRELLEEEA